MSGRRYYSTRTGKNPDALHFDLAMLRRLFLNTYESFGHRGYFQQAFGYYCVDDGDVPGSLGEDVEAAILLQLRKPLKIEPMKAYCGEYSEDDIFDLIEFLYDHVSQPLAGRYHSFGNCGMHYHSFDKGAGQEEFRQAVNAYLADYEDGFELSEQGEILAVADPGLQPLLDAELPMYDPANAEERVQAAVRKFRRHRSSIEDRREAVRALADVLEFLRPKAKEYLLTKKDDGDLFGIANNFGIRHHEPGQKTRYNKAIWYSWIFYFYLATIHAVVRVIKEQEAETSIS